MTPHDTFDDPDAPKTRKVVFCCPTITRPYAQFTAALEASVPVIQAAGWDDYAVYEIGCPYISAARSKMLRKAMDVRADVVVFLDHDLSWQPNDLLRLIECEGDVVSGNYRFKREPEEYMGECITAPNGGPVVLEDGTLSMYSIPAGFLKITRHAVNVFMAMYPELCYGDRFAPCIDLFNHGAHQWTWYGEDYAFARRWREKCGVIKLIPDLNIVHHAGDGTAYAGNFHMYLRRQPGGDLHEGAHGK
jgi:glycosyltransferase involved in cell wall biosynthesis